MHLFWTLLDKTGKVSLKMSVNIYTKWWTWINNESSLHILFCSQKSDVKAECIESQKWLDEINLIGNYYFNSSIFYHYHGFRFHHQASLRTAWTKREGTSRNQKSWQNQKVRNLMAFIFFFSFLFMIVFQIAWFQKFFVIRKGVSFSRK